MSQEWHGNAGPGAGDIYSRGPFGERLNPLKDLKQDEIFNFGKVKHAPRLQRTIGCVIRCDRRFS